MLLRMMILQSVGRHFRKWNLISRLCRCSSRVGRQISVNISKTKTEDALVNINEAFLVLINNFTIGEANPCNNLSVFSTLIKFRPTYWTSQFPLMLFLPNPFNLSKINRNFFEHFYQFVVKMKESRELPNGKLHGGLVDGGGVASYFF